MHLKFEARNPKYEIISNVEQTFHGLPFFLDSLTPLTQWVLLILLPSYSSYSPSLTKPPEAFLLFEFSARNSPTLLPKFDID